MSEQDNIRLVQKAYEFFQKGQIEDLIKLHAEDVEFISPGPPDVLHTAGTHRGHQGITQFFDTVGAEQDFEMFQPEEFIAQGDKVVALIKCRSRIKATGKIAETTLVHVFDIKDGKLQRLREFFDTAAVMSAFIAAQGATSK